MGSIKRVVDKVAGASAQLIGADDYGLSDFAPDSEHSSELPPAVVDGFEDAFSPASEHRDKVASAMANMCAEGFSPASEHLEKLSSINGEATFPDNFSPASEHFEKFSTLVVDGGEEGFSPAFEHSNKFSSIVDDACDSAAKHFDADGIAENLTSATEHLQGSASQTVSNTIAEGISHVGNSTDYATSATALNDHESSSSSDLISLIAEMGGTGKRAIQASLKWSADKLHSVVTSAFGFGAETTDTFLIHGGNPVNGSITLGQAGFTNAASVELASRLHGG